MSENILDNLVGQWRKPNMVCVARDEAMQPLDTLAHAMQLLHIPYIETPVSPAWKYGTSHNYNLDLITARYMTGFSCGMDDDDWFGVDYLAQVEATALAHPDAWVIGKAACWVRWIGGRRDGESEWSEGEIEADGRCKGVAGMTICVNIAQWIAHPEWRFRESLDDDVQLQAQALALGGSIYHHTGEFYAQRWGDPAHAHSWNNPRDHW